MSIAYSIISVDDSRKRLKDVTHRRLREYGLEELTGIEYVDGRDKVELALHVLEDGYRITGENFHNGELGLWFSTINALEMISHGEFEHVIVLEDDAVVMPSFETLLPWVMRELPENYDFFAWALPDNQKRDYYYDRTFNDTGGWYLNSQYLLDYDKTPWYIEGNQIVCRAYQGYRNVAIMYSPKGAANILALLKEKGLYTPTDLLMFQESHMGNLNGYTFYPDVAPAIDHEETGTIVRASGMWN